MSRARRTFRSSGGVSCGYESDELPLYIGTAGLRRGKRRSVSIICPPEGILTLTNGATYRQAKLKTRDSTRNSSRSPDTKLGQTSTVIMNEMLLSCAVAPSPRSIGCLYPALMVYGADGEDEEEVTKKMMMLKRMRPTAKTTAATTTGDNKNRNESFNNMVKRYFLDNKRRLSLPIKNESEEFKQQLPSQSFNSARRARTNHNWVEKEARSVKGVKTTNYDASSVEKKLLKSWPDRRSQKRVDPRKIVDEKLGDNKVKRKLICRTAENFVPLDLARSGKRVQINDRLSDQNSSSNDLSACYKEHGARWGINSSDKHHPSDHHARHRGYMDDTSSDPIQTTGHRKGYLVASSSRSGHKASNDERIAKKVRRRSVELLDNDKVVRQTNESSLERTRQARISQKLRRSSRSDEFKNRKKKITAKGQDDQSQRRSRVVCPITSSSPADTNTTATSDEEILLSQEENSTEKPRL